MKLMSGNSNPPLVEAIAAYLELPITQASVRRFAFARTTRDRAFLLSLPRLIVAIRSGAMRYGLFVWRKPDG